MQREGADVDVDGAGAEDVQGDAEKFKSEFNNALALRVLDVEAPLQAVRPSRRSHPA